VTDDAFDRTRARAAGPPYVCSQGGVRTLVFHDAVAADELIGAAEEGVARVVSEIEAGDTRFVRKRGAGTLAHFARAR
jgi:hypothetical protein